MAKVFLALGSNIGDSRANLLQAVRKIEERIGSVVSLSAFYATKPWGFESENEFLNAVVEIETTVSAVLILQIVKAIEAEMGRDLKRVSLYIDRPIDIDILFYDQETISMENLIIPHPLLHLRAFVLDPMAEIAPDFLHPTLLKTISQLRAALSDKGL